MNIYNFVCGFWDLSYDPHTWVVRTLNNWVIVTALSSKYISKAICFVRCKSIFFLNELSDEGNNHRQNTHISFFK